MMSMLKIDDESKLFGAGMAIVTAAIPDWFLTMGEKLAYAALAALLSGIFFTGGKRLIEYVWPSKNNSDG